MDRGRFGDAEVWNILNMLGLSVDRGQQEDGEVQPNLSNMLKLLGLGLDRGDMGQL